MEDWQAQQQLDEREQLESISNNDDLNELMAPDIDHINHTISGIGDDPLFTAAMQWAWLKGYAAAARGEKEHAAKIAKLQAKIAKLQAELAEIGIPILEPITSKCKLPVEYEKLGSL